LPDPTPRIGSITISQQWPRASVIVRGMHILGYVRQLNRPHAPWSNWLTTFENCRIDSSYLAVGGAEYEVTLKLHGCLIFGGINVWVYYPDILTCTILGGLSIHSHGNVDVRDNYIVGPAIAGITTSCNDALVDVLDNVIAGTQDGILIVAGGGRFERNRIEDCSGSGIRSTTQSSPLLIDNRVTRCAGHGIEILETSGGLPGATLDRNQVENVGFDGIRTAVATVSGNRVSEAGGAGIVLIDGGIAIGNWVSEARGSGIVLDRGGTATANTVLRSGESGIVLADGGLCDSNVVGHSVLDGFLDRSPTPAPSTFRSNTSFLNGGSGFEIAQSTAVTVERNIGYGNSRYGLHRSGPVVHGAQAAGRGVGEDCAPPCLESDGCNDWYGNALGPTHGVAPAETDLMVDPGFCDLGDDDVSLSAGSPLLDAPGCGRIGALGLGCTTATTHVLDGGAERLALSAHPTPTRDAVVLSWSPSAEWVEIEVFDVRGRRVWTGTAEPGSRSMRWDGRQHGAPVPDGVYFARRKGAAPATARIVLVR
jgi:hypothetical protein